MNLIQMIRAAVLRYRLARTRENIDCIERSIKLHQQALLEEMERERAIVIEMAVTQ